MPDASEVEPEVAEGSGTGSVEGSGTEESTAPGIGAGVDESEAAGSTDQPGATGRDEPFNIESRDTDIDIVSDLKLKV